MGVQMSSVPPGQGARLLFDSSSYEGLEHPCIGPAADVIVANKRKYAHPKSPRAAQSEGGSRGEGKRRVEEELEKELGFILHVNPGFITHSPPSSSQ